MLFHPRIDGRITLGSAVEAQQFRSSRRSLFRLQTSSLLHRGIKAALPPPEVSASEIAARPAVRVRRALRPKTPRQSMSETLALRMINERGAAAVDAPS